jgi:outer membrane protein
MHFSRKTFCSALAILVAAAAMSPASSRGQAAPAAANPPPTKLAVVNIVRLFEDLLEKSAADASIDKMRREFADQAQKQQKTIEDLQKQFENPPFKTNSPEYKAMQDDLLMKGMQLQSFSQFAQNKLFMERRIRTADIYSKMNAAVEEYAKANGIALVFVADDLNVGAAKTEEQLQAMVTLRKLVYFHPSFDITVAIRNKMNGEYKP